MGNGDVCFFAEGLVATGLTIERALTVYIEEVGGKGGGGRREYSAYVGDGDGDGDGDRDRDRKEEEEEEDEYSSGDVAYEGVYLALALWREVLPATGCHITGHGKHM